MNRLVRFRNVMVAAALVAGMAACKSDTREKAEEAAERLQDKRTELREEQHDLAEEVTEQREEVTEAAKDRADRLTRDDGVTGMPDRVGERLNERAARETTEDVTEEATGVGQEATELATAARDFEQRRQLRVQELRAVHGVIASQPMLINMIAGQTPLTDRARADVAEKMQVFQMRVDEAGNAIQALQGVDAASFEARDDAAAKAMDRLRDARADAWEALDKGDRIDVSSS